MSRSDIEDAYPMEDMNPFDKARDQDNTNVGFPIFARRDNHKGEHRGDQNITNTNKDLSSSAHDFEKDFDREFDKDIAGHQNRTENIFGSELQSQEHVQNAEVTSSDDSSWGSESSINENDATNINNDFDSSTDSRPPANETLAKGLEPAENAQSHPKKTESSVFTKVRSAIPFLGRENSFSSASRHHTTDDNTAIDNGPSDVLSRVKNTSLPWDSLSRMANPFNTAASGHGMVGNDTVPGNLMREDDVEAQLNRSDIGNSDSGHNTEGIRNIGMQNSSTSESLSLQIPSSQSSTNEDWINMDKFDDLTNLSEFGIDIPDAAANKTGQKKQGITTSLLRLYNERLRRHSDGYSDFSISDEDRLSKHGFMGRRTGKSKAGRLAKLKHGGKQRLIKKLTPNHKMSDARTFTLETESTSNLEHGEDELQKGQEPAIELPRFSRKRGADNDMNNFDISDLASMNSNSHKKVKFQQNRKHKHGLKKRFGREEAARITVHIADVLQRQTFILTLCKAFMMYGAPTHRLEEYMSLTAMVLETNGSFVYFPGCMLASFGDFTMRTSEMHLVRCPEGLDLGKLDEIHEIYKNVVHDREGVQEATDQLKDIMEKKPRFNTIVRVLLYAFSSAMVAPWGFGGSWIDLPICFGIGGVIGFLQFVICPRSTLYSSLFEVMASVISSFLARAIGSINGGSLFCYSSIVQSALALILPGYIILCGSLELQSRNLVAGAVRMFYAFIYSLMLSFGITLGAALYGWIDGNATSVTTCTSDINPWWRFLFVPGFTIGIALVNLASWGQLPVMVFISGAGYVVSYFSSKHFKNETELTATFGCFIIGLVSNGYSRLMKSVSKYLTKSAFMTMSLMLPGIFVQVPSGIASQGSVLVGISAANNIVHTNSSNSSSSGNSTISLGSLSFGMVMIEVALGISIGLYLATIVVYPFGKKHTGLFTL